jgi:hypothetical protein
VRFSSQEEGGGGGGGGGDVGDSGLNFIVACLLFLRCAVIDIVVVISTASEAVSCIGPGCFKDLLVAGFSFNLWAAHDKVVFLLTSVLESFIGIESGSN